MSNRRYASPKRMSSPVRYSSPRRHRHEHYNQPYGYGGYPLGLSAGFLLGSAAVGLGRPYYPYYNDPYYYDGYPRYY